MPLALPLPLARCLAWCVEPPISTQAVATLTTTWHDLLAALLGHVEAPPGSHLVDNTDFIYVRGKCCLWVS